ncbi:MAG: extradiol ring-cleavage dioxygenase, partial [Alphaproteobacteria bacterium]|nr:extradiol ring-cleavage dioxygenase [Alphaproteobacteria bacterium]
MGEIVGAAIVSHHPGLVQPKEIRVQRGNGRDSDLIEGFDRVKARIDALKPDTLVIFDTHWITTSMHLVAGAAHYKGSYTSDELPYSMSRFPYDFRGAPDLAVLVEKVAQEKKVPARNVTEPSLPLHYPTINVVHLLGAREKVLSVGTCQTAQFRHFLQMGEVLAEAVRRSDARVVLLASGAMSHKFYDLDHTPPNPRVWHPDNVSDPKNRALDMEVLDLWKQGRHDTVLDRFPELEAAKYEGHGAHYAQMMGALGGKSCKAK